MIEYIKYILDSYLGIEMLIELLLIGFAVYTVMRFLRGTGGEKLLKGIVFLVLGFWALDLLTGKLELERIDLLFKYFLVSVLVVAAVAFQPELRRGLMRLGGTRFGRSAAPEIQDVIEKLIDAVAVLSRSEIGAIIALEREVGLGDLVASGTRLDGQVSAELLNTIFWPGTPLHDMAVVIQHGRLSAAGVQLPLAEHGDYDRLLGSRHRAAIGLSKESDAAIIVVSEETGQISLALDGKLTRFLTLEQLRQQLLDLMIPITKDKSKTTEYQHRKESQKPDKEDISTAKPKKPGATKVSTE